MSQVVHLTEAVSIGLHGMIIIAREKDNLVNVQHIAEATGSSKHHVAKVFQRLVKAGFLYSHRGPTGGFTLRQSPERISLLDIYEEIEGKIDLGACPVNHSICTFDKCILENVVNNISIQFIKYLENQYVSDFLKVEAPDLSELTV